VWEHPHLASTRAGSRSVGNITHNKTGRQSDIVRLESSGLSHLCALRPRNRSDDVLSHPGKGNHTGRFFFNRCGEFKRGPGGELTWVLEQQCSFQAVPAGRPSGSLPTGSRPGSTHPELPEAALHRRPSSAKTKIKAKRDREHTSGHKQVPPYEGDITYLTKNRHRLVLAASFLVLLQRLDQ